MVPASVDITRNGYQLLVESLNDFAIFILDTDGCICSCNKATEEIMGFHDMEIRGKHISEIYSAEQRLKRVPEEQLSTASSSGRFETQNWYVRKDGSIIWADMLITSLANGEGHPIGFGLVLRNFSGKSAGEKKMSLLNRSLQERLRQSQSEISDYKHALDESSIVAITDQRGIIRYTNDNFCKISKYTREELLGQDHRIVNSGYHPGAFIRNLWVTIANGKIWRGELKNRAKDGSFYWVDTTIVPFLDEKGKPYQYLAIRSDITQRKRTEDQLQKAKEELEHKVVERTLELTQALEREKELNEMKSRFVSIASHEFRTPLSAILSSVSLIERYAAEEQTEKRHKHIERIKSSVKNLTAILDDFLSLEKLEQGRVDMHFLEFNLREFMEDIVDEMAEWLKKKRQRIQYSFKGDEMICQDKKILRNVMLNLLSNAIKYSHEEKTIGLHVESKSQNVQIAVKDEGMGIPQEAQQNLFSKFYRAANVNNIQGTGLGLNIVKRYMELLGGAISFESQENVGTTFYIEFPRTKASSNFNED
jgi:PAS domain S-box-containing protein